MRTGARLAAFALIAAPAAIAMVAPRTEAALRPSYGGVIRVAFAEPLRLVRPAAFSTVPEHLAAQCLYETLTGPNGLSREARALDGGLRWVFALSEGITFHDGTPCDAGAVAASLSRSGLAESMHAADRDSSERIERISALSPLEVEILFDRPVARPPEALADRRHAIIAPSGAGTGPFRLARFDPRAAAGGVTLRLAAFDAYRLGRPFVDAIDFLRAADAAGEWLLFARGEADLVTEPSPAPAGSAASPHRTLAAPESSLVVARLPSPLPVFAPLMARAIHPQAMLRFLPAGFTAALPLKGPQESSDPLRVPPDAACAVSAPSGVPSLERIAERLQVDLLDAGITARLVREESAEALAVIEICSRSRAEAGLPLLRHERLYAVSESLVNVGVRGCGPDLESAWKRER